jgi:hypothetical protein
VPDVSIEEEVELPPPRARVILSIMAAASDEQLRFAIAEKRLIQFTYLGALRVAEPHDYGVYQGVTRLLAYQLRGSSSRATSARGWKLLDVAKIIGCTVLNETFAGSRGEAHQRHYVWDVLYARVD